jgi:DNA-binding NarL/FixJ family response regulator
VTIRVVLADDQALIRAGFRSLIDAAEDLEVVGEASDGAEALTLTRSTRADVVVMDIRMPGMDGLAATRAITSDDDLAGVKVIILTTFEIDDYVIQAVRAGASGFIGKAVERCHTRRGRRRRAPLPQGDPRRDRRLRQPARLGTRDIYGNAQRSHRP